MSNLIKYALIGIVNTGIGYGLTFYMFYIGILPELSNFVGYFVGFFVSYFLNKRYNFKSENSHKKDLPKFLISMGLAYIINLIVLSILFRVLEINVYFSQVLAGISYILVGYLMSKYWVFKVIRVKKGKNSV